VFQDVSFDSHPITVHHWEVSDCLLHILRSGICRPQ